MENTMTVKEYDYLRELLEESTESWLAEELEKIPEIRLIALNRMVAHLKEKKDHKSIIRFKVMRDVLCFLRGIHHDYYSEPWIRLSKA